VQLLGSKQRSLSYAPDPKNILTQLEYADEVVDREIIQDGTKRQILRDCYEFLSEFAHPNSYSVSTAIEIEKGNDRFVLRYGHSLRMEEFNLIDYLVTLSAAPGSVKMKRKGLT